MYTVCVSAFWHHPMALTVRRAAHWLAHETSFLKTLLIIRMYTKTHKITTQFCNCLGSETLFLAAKRLVKCPDASKMLNSYKP